MSNSNNNISLGRIAIYVILGLILLGLIGLLVYYLFFHNRSDEEKPTPSPSSTPSQSPSSTPSSSSTSSTQSPTISKIVLSANNLANIKTQLSGIGTDYDKLSPAIKEKITHCWQTPTPTDCEF